MRLDVFFHHEHESLNMGWKISMPTKKQSKRRITMLELTVTDEQKVTVTLKPVTATGKPARVDGIPAWTVVSGNSKITPASDGLSADLISEDVPGDTVFQVIADTDLGEGVNDITAQVTLHVVDAQAANLGITAGDPVAK